MMDLVEFVLEKIKDVPLELDFLKSRGIGFETFYKTVIFKDIKRNINLVKFENRTSVSVYPRDHIKIYNRIQNELGSSFVKDLSYSNEFWFYSLPCYSSILTRDMIPSEVLEILMLLDINILSRTVKFLDKQSIEKVTKLTINLEGFK